MQDQASEPGGGSADIELQALLALESLTGPVADAGMVAFFRGGDSSQQCSMEWDGGHAMISMLTVREREAEKGQGGGHGERENKKNRLV